MKTRLLCFFTALLFLLPALACADCTHHDDDGRPYGLVPKGYVAPQPGVPGYTGDQCCVVCGAVVIHGSEIPPLPEPDNQEENKKQEEEIAPATVPEAPVVSVEQPPAVQPEPEAPVVPAEQPADRPAEPEAPVVPAVQQPEPVSPAEPEAPIVPAAQPQEEAKPEEKKQETPPQAETKPAESRQETQPESKRADLPAPPPEEKKTEEKKPEQKQTNKPKNPDKKTSGGGGKTKKAERERFSVRFPYRRVRMTPAPDFDYIAEFPGELLWPLPESPFLDMFD